MKLKLFTFLLILLINSCLVASLEISQDYFIAGETLTAKIEVATLDKTKLSFSDNDSKISVAFRTFKIENNSYLIYFNLPPELEPNVYTLDYEGIENDTCEIIEGNSSISISPPIFKLDPTKDSLKIVLTNNGLNSVDVQVASSSPLIKPARESITIPPAESRNLFINYDALPAETSQLTLSYDDRSFVIDLLVEELVIPPEEVPETIELIEGGLELVDPTPIAHTITTEQTIEGPLEFKNILNSSLHNITFHLPPNLADMIDMNVSSIKEITSNQVYTQFIWINRYKNTPAGNYSGELLIKSGEGYSTTLEFNIIISETIQEVPEEEPEETEQPEEETGFEVTEIEITNETAGIIVVPEEHVVQEETTKNRTIGIVLLIIVLLIAGILAWRLRPKKRLIPFSNYIQGFKKGAKKKD